MCNVRFSHAGELSHTSSLAHKVVGCLKEEVEAALHARMFTLWRKIGLYYCELSAEIMQLCFLMRGVSLVHRKSKLKHMPR